jgi:hypothetical protein
MSKRVQLKRARRRRAQRKRLARLRRARAAVATLGTAEPEELGMAASARAMRRAGEVAAPLAAAARHATQAALGETRTVDGVLALAAQAQQMAATATRDLRQRRPPRLPIACRKGCAWCCYLQVPVSAPEVLRITHFLRQTLSPDELEAVRARVVALDEQTRGLTARQRLAVGLPCALLAGHACSVYPVRPLACQGWHSIDARACRRNVEHPEADVAIPQYPAYVGVTDGLRDGLQAGLAELGLQEDQLELTAALRIALDLPDAAERWLAGEPVFAAARLSRD